MEIFSSQGLKNLQKLAHGKKARPPKGLFVQTDNFTIYLEVSMTALCKSPEIQQGKIGLQFLIARSIQSICCCSWINSKILLENSQNCKLSKPKVVRIESCQIVSCQNCKLPKLQVAKIAKIAKIASCQS